MTTPYTEVLFEEMSGKDGNLGIITLNRPNVLNSLNHSMVHAMYDKLRTWENADHIKAVVIRAAEGRAFCAGGDLRLTYDRMKAKDPIMTSFFHDEYQLNRLIFHYPKPYIALLNGITMGGGVGISIHGSHRIATDNLLFAMPETGIGFFPDVGGTYFLPRLAHHMGYYLGLAGARIKSDDAVHLGVTDIKVSPDSLNSLVTELAQQSFSGNDKESVSKIIEKYSVPVEMTQLMKDQQIIDHCFSANTVEAMMKELQQSDNDMCKKTAEMMSTKSPTSLKISLKAMQEGRHMDFDECMRQEYRLVTRFLLGHDFAEGIRALIIDKDQKPQWKPSTLQGVSEADVEKYFAPLTEELV